MERDRCDPPTRRKQIVQAVLDIAGSQGLRHVTIASVARRVGLVPSAVYRHFKNKDALFDAVLAFLRQELLDNVAAVRDQSDDPLERLHLLLIRHVRLIRQNAALPQIVLSEYSFSGHPERKQQVHAIISDYLRAVAEIVREGQTRGRIKADLDAETLSVMFLGLIQPGAVLWQLSDGGFDVTRHANRAWAVFSAAIRT